MIVSRRAAVLELLCEELEPQVEHFECVDHPDRLNRPDRYNGIVKYDEDIDSGGTARLLT